LFDKQERIYNKGKGKKKEVNWGISFFFIHGSSNCLRINQSRIFFSYLEIENDFFMCIDVGLQNDVK
jgi:hypothetical protein